MRRDAAAVIDRRRGCACLLWFTLMLFGGTSQAQTLDWCALGESLEPGREFIQVRHVILQMTGAPLGELAVQVSREAIRDRVFGGKADRVHLSKYDETACGVRGQASDTVELSLTAEEVAALAAELPHRGPNSREPPPAALRAALDRAAVQPAAPAAGPAGTSRINWLRIFYATNRKATGATDARRFFGREDAETLSLGTVDVSIPSDHQDGKLESPAIWRFEWVPDPERHIALAPLLTPLSPQQWRSAVAERATALGRPGVLLFVHGYNTGFSDGARRAAQFANDLKFKGPTVLYSWPSDGSLVPYMRDEADAFAAKKPMSEVLAMLTGLSPGLPVYLVAHSMGNRVLLHGLADLLRREPGAYRSLRHVVLASPDVGRREFSQLLDGELASARSRITLYASNRDLPVGLSSWLHGDQRLGTGGPSIAVFDGVDSIDASALTREFFGLNHSYFGDSTTLLSDLFDLIQRGSAPGDRRRLRRVTAPQGVYWQFSP